MDILFGGAFLGMVVYLASIPGYLRSKTDDRSPFWHPGGKGAAKRLARRVSWALSRRDIFVTWSLFMPSALVFGMISFLTMETDGGGGLGTFQWEIVVGYLLGAGISFLGSYFLGMRKAIRQHLQSVATQASKAIARRGELPDAEGMLEAAAGQSKKRRRLAAAIALRYVGTPKGNATLEALKQDADLDVRNAAQSSLENIVAVLNGDQRESVIPLEQVAIDYQRMDSQLDIVVDETHKAGLLVEYHRMREVFDRVIYAQLPLRRSFPHLFCMDCLCRAEERSFKDWSWVRCKRCKDVFGLKAGVVVVSGQIGDVTDWELHNGALKLSLWNAEERKARGAEIDRLEVVGLQDISYDWAVSAVVEQLQAFSQDGAHAAPVSLLHQPALSRNSLQLLRMIDHTLPMNE